MSDLNKEKKKHFLLFLGIAIIAVFILLTNILIQKEQKKDEDKTEKLTEVTVTPSVEPSVKVRKEPTVTEEPVVIPVDFEKLWETNRDIYAWIEIPGTSVNYPILQHETDDSYYLDHSVDGTAGLPGSIYTESYNHKDFSDCHTVIYGHNMKNGTMFGSLREYQDKKYGDKYSYIKIYTPEEILTYQIFTAVTYDNRHILYHYNPTDKLALSEFLHSMKSEKISGWIDTENEVTEDDRIVVLSTCNGNSSQRFLVAAVLTEE